ncbi:ubiquitin-like-specific protease ESD4 isoform X1 [Lolium perenne]|uniref:ubiquitin-like-specific protease ESD4 isoform X1 n=2 Tax=Lolium perenne TaxID=4522 RepID=UPI0021F5767A|nr:ubiquitin-like-specific protease ESD4 isoform X2 [Lolium perenne]
MAMQIFLPLNRGLHWYAAVIIPEERDIQILNSIPSMEPGDELQHTLEGIAAYLRMAEETLKEVSKSHKWPDYDVHLWNRTTIKNLPKQKDQSSCGLFVLLFIQYWTGKKLSKKNYTERCRHL